MFSNDAERTEFSRRRGAESGARFDALGVIVVESFNLIDTVNGAIGR